MVPKSLGCLWKQVSRVVVAMLLYHQLKNSNLLSSLDLHRKWAHIKLWWLRKTLLVTVFPSLKITSLELKSSIHINNKGNRRDWNDSKRIVYDFVIYNEGKWRESPSIMWDSLGHLGSYSPWNSPGQNIEVRSRSLLQGIFPT